MSHFIKPLFHTIALVWKHSKYYSTPSKMVILLRQVFNQVIDIVSRVFPWLIILLYYISNIIIALKLGMCEEYFFNTKSLDKLLFDFLETILIKILFYKKTTTFHPKLESSGLYQLN